MFNIKQKIIIALAFCLLVGAVDANNVYAQKSENRSIQIEGYIVYAAKGAKTFDNLMGSVKSLVGWAGCGNVKVSTVNNYINGYGGKKPEKILFDKCQNIPQNQLEVPAGLEQFHDGTYRTIYNAVSNVNMQVPNYNCSEPDRCLNVNGIQHVVPAGFRDVGGRICQLDKGDGFTVLCRPTQRAVKPGESVGFIATPFFKADGVIKYEWYSGGSASGNPVGTYNTGGASTHPMTFSNTGNHQMTVVATDSSNKRVSCTTGVMVSNDADNLNNNDSVYGDGEGVGEAKIDFSGDKGLTNDTCKITWNASNVIECYLTSDEGLNEGVSLSGSKDIRPGTYRLSCISHDLVPILSDAFICRSNPSFWEI